MLFSIFLLSLYDICDSEWEITKSDNKKCFSDNKKCFLCVLFYIINFKIHFWYSSLPLNLCSFEEKILFDILIKY